MKNDNEEVLANAFVKKALEWPPVRPDDPKALDSFAVFLSECDGAIQCIDAVKVLQYPDTMKKLVSKLPFRLHERWHGVVFNIKEKGKRVEFKDLVKFVKSETKKACDPTYGSEALKTRPLLGTSIQPRANRPTFRGSFATYNTGHMQTPQHNTCMFCNEAAHVIYTCNKFSKMKYEDKIQFLKSKGACYKCLKVGHTSSNCMAKIKCDTCQRRHPTCLHNERWIQSQQKQTEVEGKETDRKTSMASNSAKSELVDCALAVIPVKVKMRDSLKIVTTYAFLDPGSNVSFCTNKLLDQVGGSGRRMNIKLDTMGQTCTMNTLKVDGLQVCDLGMNIHIDLPTLYTKDKMPISQEHIPREEDIKSYSHLADVLLPQVDSDIGLLIGNDVPDAYSPLQLRTGPRGSPHATQSLLGWIVWNLIRENQRTDITVNRTNFLEIMDPKYLESLVHQSIDLEFPERTIDDKPEPSVDDKKFIQQAESSLELKNGHYYMNLPLKRAEVTNLPDNKPQALQRLNHLKGKMKRNIQFEVDYKKFMENLLKNGHAERVRKEHIEGPAGRTWYLPHHGVYHPRKPDKLRVVFDCSATYQGTSLNREVLQGPDLTNKLLGILLRFRQERVAVMADVEAMFHQVRVHECDRDLLRFMWWPDGHSEQQPHIYRMTVHTFGIISSPSIANFALRCTAEDNSEFSPEICAGVKRNFYVDDFLVSTSDENKAVKLMNDTSDLLAKGGFHLTKWTSNSHRVLQSIPETERSNEMKLVNLDKELPSETALGVYWKTDEDTLGLLARKKSVPLNRRGILSLTSSVYDPIGITAPYVLIAKCILQELCRLGVGWDEKINDNMAARWINWIEELDILPELQIPRCYKPDEMGEVVSCEIHSFSDASETGYGMVSYMRLEDNHGQVHCSFIFGKARVTPLKKVTIPRLELTAATAMVRQNAMLQRELDYKIDRCYFWTDSTSVLKYIRNKTCRFQTFVANRLTVIREASSIEQWKYVPTTENPADHASRGMTLKTLAHTPQWTKGPDFLWKSKDEWPCQPELGSDLQTDPEVKKIACVTSASEQSETMQRLLERFSDWKNLKRVVAWILIAKENLRKFAEFRRDCRQKLQDSNLSEEEREHKVDEQVVAHKKHSQCELLNVSLTVKKLRAAEQAIVQYVQSQHFSEEMTSLLKMGAVKKSSDVLKLDPFLGEDGVLRVGGRLERSTLPFDARFQILLPKESMVSKLILMNAHQDVGHMGKNAVLAVVRQKYWICGAKGLLKNILAKCVLCKSYQSTPVPQKMSSLPIERVTDQPPFSKVGMDFFGPFEVKRGRSIVKRYGVIFTCLVVRAVHLEVAADLSTDACIQAIRRFIARRGPVSYIRSDNGTNLVGAERELREALQNLDHPAIKNFLLDRQIEWEFNTPAASNFGGVWERIIRLVRKVMYSLLHTS